MTSGGGTDAVARYRAELARARKAKKLRQEDLARKLGIGKRWYRALERGDRPFPPKYWPLLQDAGMPLPPAAQVDVAHPQIVIELSAEVTAILRRAVEEAAAVMARDLAARALRDVPHAEFVAEWERRRRVNIRHP